MKIAIGSDHAGVDLKRVLADLLIQQGHSVDDVGTHSRVAVDYPDFADLVCRKIHGFSLVQESSTLSMPAEIGILICGSGQGMVMRANKFAHIRAALCWTPELARLSREHNDANVLCLGSRVTANDVCKQIVQIFLTTPFAGGRHARRVAKVSTPV